MPYKDNRARIGPAQIQKANISQMFTSDYSEKSPASRTFVRSVKKINAPFIVLVLSFFEDHVETTSVRGIDLNSIWSSYDQSPTSTGVIGDLKAVHRVISMLSKIWPKPIPGPLSRQTGQSPSGLQFAVELTFLGSMQLSRSSRTANTKVQLTSISYDHFSSTSFGLLLVHADSLRSRGNYGLAVCEFYAEPVRRQQKYDNSRQSFKAAIFYKLAIASSNVHRYDEALRLFGRCMQISKNAFGDDHLNTAYVLENIGVIYAIMGEYTVAIRYFQQALSTKVKWLGECHPRLVDVYKYLGEVHFKMGQFHVAKIYFEHALMISESNSEPESLRTMEIMEDVARTYNNLGLYASALALYEKICEAFETRFGTRHLRTADAINNMAITYQALCQYDRAMGLFDYALSIYGREDNEVGVRRANTMNNLGVVHSQKGNYSAACYYLLQALQLKKEQFGEDHIINVDTINNLAIAYGGMGEVKRAVALYWHAITITKRNRGSWNIELGDMYNNLGMSYWALGKFELAEEDLSQSRQIYNSLLGKDHPKSSKAEELHQFLTSKMQPVKVRRKRGRKPWNRRR
jgi:tetratricopeptide (TPR) repeat protein